MLPPTLYTYHSNHYKACYMCNGDNDICIAPTILRLCNNTAVSSSIIMSAKQTKLEWLLN